MAFMSVRANRFRSWSPEHDALLLAGGAEEPRDLPIPGRELEGVHFAMDFLPQQNRRVGGESQGASTPILASGKHVVVIGGGDTGSDCIGTSFRQGALSVTQLEIMPTPPLREDKALTWPHWPLKFRTSSSQAEGANRDFSVMTTQISGQGGRTSKLHCVRVDDQMKPVAGSEFEIQADLILLAMGFVHPIHEGMVEYLGLDLDPRGNVMADTREYRTSRDGVFSAGDMRRGQSLVVWAIREGRQAAQSIDRFLTGASVLPRLEDVSCTGAFEPWRFIVSIASLLPGEIISTSGLGFDAAAERQDRVRRRIVLELGIGIVRLRLCACEGVTGLLRPSGADILSFFACLTYDLIKRLYFDGIRRIARNHVPFILRFGDQTLALGHRTCDEQIADFGLDKRCQRAVALAAEMDPVTSLIRMIRPVTSGPLTTNSPFSPANFSRSG